MPFKKRNRINCKCNHCQTVVAVNPCNVHRWRYCSHECKAKAQIGVPTNRIRFNVAVICDNILCQNDFSKPLVEYKKAKKHYCCEACKETANAPDFKEKILAVEEKVQEQFKRNIWFL